MVLTITLTDLDNDAFEGDFPGELERILVGLCSRVPETPRDTEGELSLHDANGNYVGSARIINTRG